MLCIVAWRKRTAFSAPILAFRPAVPMSSRTATEATGLPDPMSRRLIDDDRSPMCARSPAPGVIPGMLWRRAAGTQLVTSVLNPRVPRDLELANAVGQRIGQDHPQPRDSLGLRRTSKLVTVLMGLQERLLHQVRRIELALKSIGKLKPGQEAQVAAVRFHRTHGNDPFAVRAD